MSHALSARYGVVVECSCAGPGGLSAFPVTQRTTANLSADSILRRTSTTLEQQRGTCKPKQRREGVPIPYTGINH